MTAVAPVEHAQQVSSDIPDMRLRFYRLFLTPLANYEPVERVGDMQPSKIHTVL
jgi:hypothetical protein